MNTDTKIKKNMNVNVKMKVDTKKNEIVKMNENLIEKVEDGKFDKIKINYYDDKNRNKNDNDNDDNDSGESGESEDGNGSIGESLVVADEKVSRCHFILSDVILLLPFSTTRPSSMWCGFWSVKCVRINHFLLCHFSSHRITSSLISSHHTAQIHDITSDHNSYPPPFL